ncbi:hypothetical protein [Methylobacterium durans]|uniref:DUF1508 domain-containing protein n=2 Tax=Methylobacterium durans TaxID=2202825 RepID=A0A2U8W3C5_9HYPH|nr:hypothetical protein [Methylobacterium durans]AWN40158.1 hypothetical protein DK389_05895 [Methylobacterium durans]
MTNEIPHPYEIEVLPLEKPAGAYRWVLRRGGKLLERSDRPHPSEEKAWASAVKALEGDLTPTGRRR